MNIQDLGSLGELFGSVLVGITLVYLAIQLRQSTKAANIQAHAALSSEMEQTLLAVARDDVLAEGLQKAFRGEDLSALEQAKLTWWFGAFQRVAESHILQAKHGLMEDVEAPVRVVLRGLAGVDLFRNLLTLSIEAEAQTVWFRDWVKQHVLDRAETTSTFPGESVPPADAERGTL